MKSFSIIVAATADGLGIGRAGALPWRIAEDTAFFKRVTTTAALLLDVSGGTNAVIMGRKTYESLSERYRPLPDRINVVLSRDPEVRQKLALPASVLVAGSLSEALRMLAEMGGHDVVRDVFVIGGGEVYRDALPRCSKIYMTEVGGVAHDIAAGLDAFFPEISAREFRMVGRSKMHHQIVVGGGEKKKEEEETISFRFTEYDRIIDEEVAAAAAAGNAEERQYLDLVRDIIDRGVVRGDRTGTGTRSIFGAQMRFSLRDNAFPLLTTKRVFWRGVAEELLWIVSGSTNGNLLAAKGIHIWDGNGSRAFLDARGLGHREVGDLGQIYGFQWRHFGATYTDMHADYSEQGVDQLRDCIDKIKNTPEDRRIVLSAWNPADLSGMALPPCHMMSQFYVADGELSCQMYQRSADLGLGVPFNIASYALLTAMMAQVCGLKCGDFVHTIGDAHVYLNHVDALKQQLLRVPRAFPKLRVNPDVTDIDQFKFSDFTLEGYTPDAGIKMEMAV